MNAPFAISVRSSWTVDGQGVVYAGRVTPARAKGYRCSKCGRRGHNARTCKEPTP